MSQIRYAREINGTDAVETGQQRHQKRITGDIKSAELIITAIQIIQRRIRS